jgi:hypothetical protein
VFQSINRHLIGYTDNNDAGSVGIGRSNVPADGGVDLNNGHIATPDAFGND